MRTQTADQFTPMQTTLAAAFRVHKINVTFSPALFPASAYMSIWGLARLGRNSPPFWQEFIGGIDALTGKPLAEMQVKIGPATFSVHDILVLLSRMEFDLTPRNDIHGDFSVAVARALLANPDITSTDVDQVETAMAVYRQIAIQLIDLVAEWLLVNSGNASIVEAIGPIADAMEANLRAYLSLYIPAGMEDNLGYKLREGIYNWARHYGPQSVANPGPVKGVIMWSGALLRTILSDIPGAEEYLLSSSDVQYNKEYEGIPQVDRDYIYFHRVIGAVEQGSK